MWKVLRVIWVEGSPTDCAAITPTASPGCTMHLWYLTYIRRWKSAATKQQWELST